MVTRLILPSCNAPTVTSSQKSVNVHALQVSLHCIVTQFSILSYSFCHMDLHCIARPLSVHSLCLTQYIGCRGHKMLKS